MRRKDFIPIVFLLTISGCYPGIYLPGVEVQSNFPRGGSGVQITNNIPGSKLVIKKVAIRTSGVIKELETGGTFFVKADFAMDRHEMAITVTGYVGDEYIGSETKRFSFSPSNQKIYTWDVSRLTKGRY